MEVRSSKLMVDRLRPSVNIGSKVVMISLFCGGKVAPRGFSNDNMSHVIFRFPKFVEGNYFLL